MSIKTRLLFFALLLFLPHSIRAQSAALDMQYTIDLTHFESDSFFLTLDVSGLTADSVIYQFAVTAPGTYSVLDAGRFIGGFSAYDSSGIPLDAYPLNVNQYVIRNASRLSRIVYKADDTFESDMKINPVLPMSGTNLERDNAVINHQMIIGYLRGFQNNPVRVKYSFEKGWESGSAIPLQNGQILADSYEQLAGTPVLFSDRLTADSLTVNKTRIYIYCYSESGRTAAIDVKKYISKTMQATNKFLNGLPVDRYTFLFHFRKNVGGVYGAWEHRNSSIYVIPENDLSVIAQTVLTMTAHEFFHVVTPLTIHSDSIRPFAFDRTVPTRHLWFFEGVTEWASDIMFLRTGLMTENQFFDQISQKLNRNDAFDSTVSLTDLSLGSFGRFGSQYQNVYDKGALVAWLLDLRLLELSKGKRGLRELVLELGKRYTLKNAFKDEEFFKTITDMTHPEIADFIKKYISGTERLPVGEYLDRLGYRYISSKPTGRYIPNAGTYELLYDGNKTTISNMDPADSVNMELGVKNGDELLELKYLHFDIAAQDPSFYFVFFLMTPGQPFQLKVNRNGQEMNLRATVGQKEDFIKHQIIPMEEPSKDQKQFRKWWLKKI